MVQLRELFMGLDVSLSDSLRLFLYLTPLFMLIMLPLSTMFAVFLTFLRMSADRELVALKAGGISLRQILPGPAIFSLLICLLTVFISLYGISWGMGSFRSLVIDIAHNRARLTIQPGVFNQDIFGVTLFAKKVDLKTDTMHDIIFEDRTKDKEGGTRIMGIASQGTLTKNQDRRQITFALENGKLYRLDGKELSVLHFGEYSINIDLDKIFSSFKLEELKPRDMSWAQLRALDPANATAEQDERFWRKLQVEEQKRLALPVACLVLGLFAVPLACSLEGIGKQKGAPLIFAFFLLYYSLLSLGIGLGESGNISPVLGLWLPNIVFSIIGGYGLYLASIERSPTFFSLFVFLRGLLKKPASQIKP